MLKVEIAKTWEDMVYTCDGGVNKKRLPPKQDSLSTSGYFISSTASKTTTQ